MSHTIIKKKIQLLNNCPPGAPVLGPQHLSDLLSPTFDQLTFAQWTLSGVDLLFRENATCLPSSGLCTFPLHGMLCPRFLQGSLPLLWVFIQMSPQWGLLRPPPGLTLQCRNRNAFYPFLFVFHFNIYHHLLYLLLFILLTIFPN